MPEANEDVDWEAVVHSNEQRTDRLAVPGGWLYRVRQWKLKPHEGGSYAGVWVTA